MSFENVCRDFNRSQKCRHRKGNLRSVAFDSSMRMHTFIDSSQRIKCDLCSFEVWNKPEFSFKWAYALKFMENTTNHPSSSERLVPEFKGHEAGCGEFRFKDLMSDIDKKGNLPLKEEEGPIKGHQPSLMDWRAEDHKSIMDFIRQYYSKEEKK